MKIGNGFGFKIVQAVFYTLAVLLFVALGAVFTVRASNFPALMVEENGTGSYAYADGYYKDGVFREVFNGYSDGEQQCCKIVLGGDGAFSLEIREKTPAGVNEASYDLESSDNASQILTFSGGGETVTMKYEDFSQYMRWDEQKTMSIVFFVLGGFLAAVDALHLIATIKGKKSMGANTLGIVVNTPFALCPFGLCGLIGCVKGRMYLQFSKVGCEPGASAAEQAVAQAYSDNQIGVSEPEFDDISGATASYEGQTAEKREIKKSDFTLDLYDASIDEKTWKEFKKTASQEELAVIAIGAKYRVAHGRIKNILFALGIVLSIALFWPTGGFSLIAYPVFAFLATKAIRYEDTLSQSYKKLDKENKAFVDGYFNCGVGWKILDIIIKLGVFYLTIPYQAILLLIGTFAPNFVIAKNGVLVSIPKGYDVGNLGAVGAYYGSFSFIDEAADSRRKYTGTVTVEGHEISVHSADDITYYDDNGNAYSKEGSKLVKK